MRRAIQVTGAVTALCGAATAMLISVTTPDTAEHPALTAAFVALILVGALLGLLALPYGLPEPQTLSEAYRQGRNDARAEAQGMQRSS
ncbi:putative membrane protein YadS [Nonomuraea endophytica]|uniref:Putative membrane protein YadS n=1 Tax=Nonomuraea endophytica TaxID=714136 RepID=A0A7W8EK38_9ACTN|nr:putative membrane protein YadS [Nonomuraea endophytica]